MKYYLTCYLFFVFLLNCVSFVIGSIDLVPAQIQVLWEKTNQSPRQANSDNVNERLYARLGMAYKNINKTNFKAAFNWIDEYSVPSDENLKWPNIQGYLLAATIKAEIGQTFDALHRINIAVDKSKGLSKVAALHTLSEIVQSKPDLKNALKKEQQALSAGNSYFKRKKVSDTSGLEPPKEGHEVWKEWKPIIEARIEELKELADIEEFGLDYVIYRKAQRYRRADHPRALDFVSVGHAFGLDPEGPGIRDADFEAAHKWYGEIIKTFPNGVYTDASKLYAAACLVHLEDARSAIREWMAFYRENPDGLYRGEALKLIGDTYLTNLWDRRNAREAYTRAVAWVESVGERTRILETYVVPEKSAEVSRPPKTAPREFDEFGHIEKSPLEAGILFNRMTASWYLDDLRVELEWRLGFLELLDGNQEAATLHFDQALAHDVMLRRAQSKKYYNAHGRMIQALKQTALVETEAEMKGIRGKRKLAMEWADLMFLLGNFDEAQSLYRRIQWAGEKTGDAASVVRAALGEAHLVDAMNREAQHKTAPYFYNICMKWPDAPATPKLLFDVSLMSPREPIGPKEVMQQFINEYPKHELIPKARYLMIYRYTPWREHETRVKLSEQFMREFPNETQLIETLKRHDRRVRKLLREQMGENPPPPHVWGEG